MKSPPGGALSVRIARVISGVRHSALGHRLDCTVLNLNFPNVGFEHEHDCV